MRLASFDAKTQRTQRFRKEKQISIGRPWLTGPFFFLGGRWWGVELEWGRYGTWGMGLMGRMRPMGRMGLMGLMERMGHMGHLWA